MFSRMRIGVCLLCCFMMSHLSAEDSHTSFSMDDLNEATESASNSLSTLLDAERASNMLEEMNQSVDDLGEHIAASNWEDAEKSLNTFNGNLESFDLLIQAVSYQYPELGTQISNMKFNLGSLSTHLHTRDADAAMNAYEGLSKDWDKVLVFAEEEMGIDVSTGSWGFLDGWYDGMLDWWYGE
ncbi:MAG: hypothetical protein CMO81_07210 [Waddliaceae bacterium]|nr:hypothetical protein [Waddliaceae bacterium]